MPNSWLAGKPVIPGSKSIAATRAAPPGHDTWIAARCPAYQLPPAGGRATSGRPGPAGGRTGWMTGIRI